MVAPPALTAHASDDPASLGRRIFNHGGSPGEVLAKFAGTNSPLPPFVRRCAGCHGPKGEGGREGGFEIQPIAWTVLSKQRDASPRQPGRPGYDEAALARALAEGIDPAGRRLASAMPRFQLTPAQGAALSDYLRIVGTDRDLDPGLGPDEISIGAVLPLSGTQATWGWAIRAGLENAFATAGPIYGRRLRLVTADGSVDVAAALHRLAANDDVFALVSTLLPVAGGAVEETEDMPVIGPLAPTPAHPPANQFYLMASVEDQMRVLVDELASEAPRPVRLAIVGPEGAAADAVADQAARNGVTVVRRTDAEDLRMLPPPTPEMAPDAIVVLPGVDLARVVAQLGNRQGAYLIAGPAEAIPLAGATDERLRLVLPVLPPDSRYGEVMPPLAVAAGAVLVEGLKRMGARASRAGLIAAIETLRGFPTGVLPPETFGPGQHRGNRASIVVRPDRNEEILILEGWRAPR